MKRIYKWALILAIAVLGFAGFPSLWLLFTEEARNEMGIIFLSVLGLYPLLSLCIGIVAGSDIKGFWYAPFVIVAVFIPYTAVLFREFVPEMLIYGGIYLIASFSAMALTHKITKFLTLRKEEKAFMVRKESRRNKKQ